MPSQQQSPYRWDHPGIVTEAESIHVHGQQRPRHPALIHGNERLGYGELDSRVSQVANGLLALDLPHQARVAILTKNRNEFFEPFYGIVRAGLTVLPLNWRLTVPELTFILQDAETECLFFEADFRATVTALQQNLPALRIMKCIGADDSYAAWRDSQSATYPAKASSLSMYCHATPMEKS